MSIVLRFSVELPPAPYVTDTNVGFRRDSSASARPRLRSPSSVLGGKNSNEKDGSSPAAIRSSIRIVGRSLGGARAPALRLIAQSRGAPRALEVRDPAQHLGQQPARGLRLQPLAVDGG